MKIIINKKVFWFSTLLIFLVFIYNYNNIDKIYRRYDLSNTIEIFQKKKLNYDNITNLCLISFDTINIDNFSLKKEIVYKNQDNIYKNLQRITFTVKFKNQEISDKYIFIYNKKYNKIQKSYNNIVKEQSSNKLFSYKNLTLENLVKSFSKSESKLLTFDKSYSDKYFIKIYNEFDFDNKVLIYTNDYDSLKSYFYNCQEDYLKVTKNTFIGYQDFL